MKTLGRHVLAEFHGCDPTVLDDKAAIETLMTTAARAAGAAVVGAMFHTFAPQGVSGDVVIEESHLSIHTWPEHGYAAADFFTCGECDPEEARRVLTRGLRAQRSEVMHVMRGREMPRRAMEVVRHYTQHGRTGVSDAPRNGTSSVTGADVAHP